MHHDVGLIVYNVDIVGEKADEEKKNRWDVDRDQLVVIKSPKHNCELGIVGPGMGRSVDDLKLIQQEGSNIGNIFRNKLYQVCNRTRDSQINVTCVNCSVNVRLYFNLFNNPSKMRPLSKS